MERAAELREPAATPHPVAVGWVEQRRHEQAVDQKRAELPALHQRARRDCGGRIHEYGCEQEHGQVARIARNVDQRELACAEEPETAYAELVMWNGMGAEGGKA